MRQERNILRPLSARSVVASTLLGCHPPELPTAALVEMGKLYGVAEGTLRVALSRMLSAGELEAIEGGYRLAGPLLGRQIRQEEGWRPTLREWDGAWTMAVVVVAGRSAGTRAELRAAMVALRLAELREGVWLRPDNLDVALTTEVLDRVRILRSRDDDPAELAATLWDLPGWIRTGRGLLDEMATATDIPGRFVAAAGMVRHLLTDPVLPGELLPDDWPGDALRTAYTNFAAELVARRDGIELMEAT